MRPQNAPSTPEMVASALGTQFYSDHSTNQVYLEQGSDAFASDDLERRLVYIGALRGIVRLRREMYPEIKPIEWMPTEEDTLYLRSELEPIAKRLCVVNAVQNYSEGSGYDTNNHTLREHQTEVFHKLATFISSGPRSSEGGKHGYIKMPTGTGKTVVFNKLVEAVNQSEKPIKSLVLVPSKDILAQTVGKDGNKGFGKFAEDLDVTSYFQDEKNLSGEVVVMTYQSFNILVGSGRLPNSFCDVVIYDEAHHTLGPVTKKNVIEFSKDKIAIGLTATPEYGSNKSIEEVFGTCIYELDLRDAIEAGILAPVKCWLYKTDFKIDINPEITTKFTTKEFQRMAELEARNRAAVKLAKSFVNQGLQGLISCVPGEDIVHPVIVAEMLEETLVHPPGEESRPIRVKALRGDMKAPERRKIYQQFEDGQIDILTYVDLIGEGWDSEAAKFLINLRPTCSPVYGVQRLGRILRPTDNNNLAYVVDFLDITSKSQFTALHALGEYRYHPDKVYGTYFGAADGPGHQIELPEELKQKIRIFNAKRIREITINPEYKPTHSDLIPLSELAAQLKLDTPTLFNIARFLGVEMVLKKQIHDPKSNGKLYIEDRHIEIVVAQLRLSRFRPLIESRMSPDQRRTFFENLFKNVPKNKRSACIKEVYVDQSLQDDTDIVVEQVEEALDTLEKRVQPVGRRELSLVELTKTLLVKDAPQSKVVTESLLHGIAQRPDMAVSMLAINGQLDSTAQPKIEFEKLKLGFRCVIQIEDKFGNKYSQSSSATSKKKAEQAAALQIVAEMSGVSLSNADVDLYAEIEQLEQTTEVLGANNPRGQVNQYSQITRRQVTYDTREVKRVGEYIIFESELTLVISGELVTLRGRGLNKKQAEHAAAEQATKLSAMQKFWGSVESSVVPRNGSDKVYKNKTKDVKDDPKKYIEYGGMQFSLAKDPVSVPYQWQQVTGERVNIEFEGSSSGGWVCIITRQSPNGPIQTAGILQRSKRDAKAAAARLFVQSITDRE